MIGNRYRRFSRSMGILALTWSLVAVVIVNAYYSGIISYLSANNRKPEVSNFQELAENDQYQMIAVKGSVVEFDVAVIFYSFRYRIRISNFKMNFLQIFRLALQKFFRIWMKNTNGVLIVASISIPNCLPRKWWMKTALLLL